MNKEDVIKVIFIIAFALALRDYCDGVTKSYEELQDEIVEILTHHFGVWLTIENDKFLSPTDTNIRQTNVKSKVESC